MEILRLADTSVFYHIYLGLAINIYRTKKISLSISDVNTPEQQGTQDALEEQPPDENKLAKTSLENKLYTLNKYRIPQPDVFVLDGLIGLYEKAIEGFAFVVSEKNTDDHIAILSKIRYNYISMIYDFKLYMEQITDRKGE